MDPTSRGTLITGRMSTNDLLKGSDMDMYRMNDMEQKHMNVNLMNNMGMRRNNMDLIMGQRVWPLAAFSICLLFTFLAL